MSTLLSTIYHYGVKPFSGGMQSAANAAHRCNLISQDTLDLFSGKRRTGFFGKIAKVCKQIGAAFAGIFKKEKPLGQSGCAASGASWTPWLAGTGVAAGAAACYRKEIAEALHPVLRYFGVTKPVETATEVAHHISAALGSGSGTAPQQASSSLLGTVGNLAFNRYTLGTGLAAAGLAAYHSGVFTKAAETVNEMTQQAGRNIVEGGLRSITETFATPEQELSGDIGKDVSNVIEQKVKELDAYIETKKKECDEYIEEKKQEVDQFVDDKAEDAAEIFTNTSYETLKANFGRDLSNVVYTCVRVPFDVAKSPFQYIRNKWNGV